MALLKHSEEVSVASVQSFSSLQTTYLSSGCSCWAIVAFRAVLVNIIVNKSAFSEYGAQIMKGLIRRFVCDWQDFVKGPNVHFG